jgi:hypothetical protein
MNNCSVETFVKFKWARVHQSPLNFYPIRGVFHEIMRRAYE